MKLGYKDSGSISSDPLTPAKFFALSEEHHELEAKYSKHLGLWGTFHIQTIISLFKTQSLAWDNQLQQEFQSEKKRYNFHEEVLRLEQYIENVLACI